MAATRVMPNGHDIRHEVYQSFKKRSRKSCLVGLQFTWGTEMTYCTPYLLSLGLSKSKTSLVWIAGPISGLLVQPIVGILADKSRSRWGRRRPFMVGGAAIVCVCLFILGWTTEIVEFFTPDSKAQNQSKIILLAVFSIYGVDFAINAVQASCRSLIVDTLPVEKQQTGSAWATRMAAVGHVIGYILGSIDLHKIFGDYLGDTQFKQVVVVAALGLVFSIGVTSWAVTEKVLVSDGTDTTSQNGPFAMLIQILRTTLNLPARMRAICWIQFWSWIGWFPFLFYSTTWIGEIYLRQHARTSEGKVSDDALADIGRVGSTSLVIFSVIMLLGSLLIPFLVECPEDDASFGSRLPPSPSQIMAPTNKRKPSLLTAWTWSNILFALMLIVTPFVSTMQSASFIVAICGLPWALAIWAPFALMGVEINMLSSDSIPYMCDRSPERFSIAMVDSQLESTAKQEGLLNDGRRGFEETAGVYLGILNLFTTLPQFVGTFISMIVFRILEPGKDQELVHSIHTHQELDRAAAASLFAQNPKLVSMIQGKLGTLVGRSSGYIESLPAPVRRRVAGLKGVQKDHAKLEAEFQEEILQLEKRYFAKFTPLYEKRARIVNGQAEPTEEEVEAGEKKEVEDEEGDEEEAKELPEPVEATETSGVDVKGIPEFWLSAMKNQISLAELITDRDEAALRHLSDIRMEYLDKPGFRLIFEFAENEFFTNKTITKTYFYQEENGYGGDFIYDHAEGDTINWNTGKDLTVKIESKKQRNKNTKQTRVIKKSVPTESFFNFFSPPKPPSEEDAGDAASDIEERLELDYQLGEDIKEKLIPRAIDWFTGEALQYEQLEDEMEDGEFEDEDDEDDEDLSEDRDEDEEDDDDVSLRSTPSMMIEIGG
ncbi:MAG: hypothetical protein Q9165_004054 [Trypethelium subeluteriae]